MYLPNRKTTRLIVYNYNNIGSYFVTLCVKERKRILSDVVGTGVPTGNNSKFDNSNSIISKFVSTFKRFCNKEYGENIWQSRYYDHIIRNEIDYNETVEYIENNPLKWILTTE